MRASGTQAFLAAVALVATGCSSSVVTTKETRTQAEASSPQTAPQRPSNEKLVNGFDYYVSAGDKPGDAAGYYFVTPSGSWRCAILPRAWAGCQSANGAGRIAIAGAPQTVTDDNGKASIPNAIVVTTMGDPEFASISADQFKPATGAAQTLPYNKVLAAAGFRCNVQDKVGVSCYSEEADNGFTFTNDKFSWQYTDVP